MRSALPDELLDEVLSRHPVPIADAVAACKATGVDLDGNDVELEADELFSRLIQHEVDHLDGVLLLEHLDDDQRRTALKELHDRNVAAEAEKAERRKALGGLQLP